MKRGDIYRANIQYRLASYPRPCVIIDVALPNVHVGLISSRFDLFNAVFDFRIDVNHPDFAATGLDRASYVIGSMLPRIPTTAFIKHMGELTGDLYSDFVYWLG